MLDATPPPHADFKPADAMGRLSRYVTPGVVAVAAFAVLMTAVLVAAMARTAGHFVYSLDDPYIHLALAERLARGHYGINLFEVTSPSSSIIWPFLLIPGADTSFHSWLPLALNFAFGCATAWLYGRFAADLPFVYAIA